MGHPILQRISSMGERGSGMQSAELPYGSSTKGCDDPERSCWISNPQRSRICPRLRTLMNSSYGIPSPSHRLADWRISSGFGGAAKMREDIKMSIWCFACSNPCKSLSLCFSILRCFKNKKKRILKMVFSIMRSWWKQVGRTQRQCSKERAWNSDSGRRLNWASPLRIMHDGLSAKDNFNLFLLACSRMNSYNIGLLDALKKMQNSVVSPDFREGV
eukprot:c24841_g1_i2 orf=479-1126(-)